MKHLLSLLLTLTLSTAHGQNALEALAGQWQLIASNNGFRGDDGIYRMTTDTIPFTATLVQTADSTCLQCHADVLYNRTGQDYPADWRMSIEQDPASGKFRLGFLLDDQQPASTKEFWEDPDQYLEEGFYYFGIHSDRTDTGHRYIYLLSENIATQQLESMTLWSSWQSDCYAPFAFPQNQQIYAVVSPDQPFGAESHSIVGYFEIWASPKVQKIADDTAIRELADGRPASTTTFDLQGRPLSVKPRHGVYIQNGKKYVR